MDRQTPLSKVVGKKTAQVLADELELHNVADLLQHYPRRYATRGEHTDLDRLVVGEQATILAQVQRTNTRSMRNRRGTLLEVVVGEPGRRGITLTFFNQAWRSRDLTPGVWGLFAGKVAEFRGARQLNNPEYQLLSSDADADPDQLREQAVEEFAGKLIPVYPASGGVPSWVIARCLRIVLDTLPPVEDPLPGEIRRKGELIDLDIALHTIHRPGSQEELAPARQRLAFDEAFGLQVVLAQRRIETAKTPAVGRKKHADGILSTFDGSLPFKLTKGQQSVGETIEKELAASTPMHRLLQGEVGSGKTLVAVRAMLQVVDAGGQAVLLAPTEVLATQHARSISTLLGPSAMAGQLGAADAATRVVLLTGSLAAPAKREALAQIASGEAGIVVGTHALLSDGVDFADLGLVVVDEQHRFGVEQRDALRAKGATPPHVLVMTATPIPRTVAMTVFGDLDVSVLDELPAGRSPIATSVVPVAEKPSWLERTWQRLREEVEAGRRAYVVFPRIGGDGPEDTELEEQPRASLLGDMPALIDGPLSGLRAATLHGRLAPDEKDAAMSAFSQGKADVLFATTIVEVGVDVPAATVMVICDADRFGISQLHQLRGRVGRGKDSGLCLLLTNAPAGSSARIRLDAVASTLDGFRLAELDLEQRREGDILGATQSGRRSQLKILSLLEDEDIIALARTEATALVSEDPHLVGYPPLARAIAELLDEDRSEYLSKG